MASNILEPKSSWVIPKTLPDLSQYPEICIDLETYDPNLKAKGPGWCRDDGFVVGVAVAVENKQWYFPIGHVDRNCSEAIVCRWLQKYLGDSQLDIIFFNAIYDLGWLRWMGVEVKGKIHDPKLAGALLNENRLKYNLDGLAYEYLDSRKDYAVLKQAALAYGLKNPYLGLHLLPAKFVGPYAEQDAALTLELHRKFKGLLFKEDVQDIYNLEIQQLPILLDMRSNGVHVDEEKAHALGKRLKQIEEENIFIIQQESKLDIDIWSNLSIQAVFNKLAIPYNRTEKGNPSFPAKWLTNHQHPIAQALVQARVHNRARSTFSSGLITDHAYKGKIHCQFHQLKGDEYGTVTGRTSSSTPNLQQIPVRNKDIGPLIRSIFVPGPSLQWLKADYSQQEFRLLVHYADLLALPGAGAARRYYQTNKDADFHQMIMDMANIDRDTAKTINFGLSYGMGIGALALELDVPESKAAELMEQYNTKVPFVKSLSTTCRDKAERVGFIRTLLGRRCRFNKWQAKDFDLSKIIPAQIDPSKLRELIRDKVDGGFKTKRSGITRAFTYRAMNRLIQGSAADMIKKALVEVYKAGFVPEIQVHDELDFAIEDPAQAKQIKEIMENCVRLNVPVKVDTKIGKSWGELD